MSPGAPDPTVVPLPRSTFDSAVFDLDGVVTDSARAHAAAWKQVFDDLLGRRGIEEPFGLDHDYLTYVDGRARYDGAAAFLRSRAIDLPWGDPGDEPGVASVCAIGNRKDEIYLQHLSSETVSVFADATRLIGTLRGAGLRVALASASRNATSVLRLAGIEDLFDARVTGVEADRLGLRGKPDAELFLEAAHRVGTTPSRSALFEDATAGVEAGRRGGFGLVVGVDRGGHRDGLLASGADVVVDDLTRVVVDLGTDPIPEPPPPGHSDEGWSIIIDAPTDEPRARVHDGLLSQTNGWIGIRGGTDPRDRRTGWLAVAAGAWGAGEDGSARLLPGPSLAPLRADTGVEAARQRRRLDLRTGLLASEIPAEDRRATRMVSLTRPGLVAVRASQPIRQGWSDEILVAPSLGHGAALAARATYAEGTTEGGVAWAETTSDRARILAVAEERRHHDGERESTERYVVYATGDRADREEVVAALRAATSVGFDALAAESSEAWAQRWKHAAVTIDGDPEAERAVRFALFHLLSSAPDLGEAAVGARGLTGLGYAGHVFWDAEAYVLPALAATFPRGARSLLEYRIRRLDAARAAARADGHDGARFPWESADSGHEVAPESTRDLDGNLVPIGTGPREQHISSDIAWAACHYLDWTADDLFLDQGGRSLVLDTARYWASRLQVDCDGRPHLLGVMGPDEYHDRVDDNAYTNGMVRWHLRRAAALLGPGHDQEAARWRELATGLSTGFDPATGRHEQFAGFDALEPLLVEGLGHVPLAVDILLGGDRVAQTQIIKQPDVLMLHQLLPDEMPPGSLAADLAHYLPRTAHGSSLSPAICACLLARAGQPDQALELFDIAGRLDLDDLSGTTANGLHLATMGALWQATVFGFAGVWPHPTHLRLEPHLPDRWTRLIVNLLYQGVPVRITIAHDAVDVTSGRPVEVRLQEHGARTPARFARHRETWRPSP